MCYAKILFANSVSGDYNFSMQKILTGLDQLIADAKWHKLLKGNIGYLCHSASVTENLELGIGPLKTIVGGRLKKIFGPQHGLVTDVQDNMVESDDFIHPFYKLPVYSLYSTTRVPTPEMLQGLDTFVVDLQDVGTRVYTYITTLALVMQACAEAGISVIVLDRPNPVGGTIIEGNVLDMQWRSFVGHHPIPMRHAMTMGEMAHFTKNVFNLPGELHIVPMLGWRRSMFFKDSGLTWINPSPNLPTMDGALTFVGSVLFEGTNISEGRGTTRSLEMIGHPKIEPFSFCEKILPPLKATGLTGFTLRPLVFQPTFQKHAGRPCGGLQIHVTDAQQFRPWALGQLLLKLLKVELAADFAWNDHPYEYAHEQLAIDLINGTDQLRLWVENKTHYRDLLALEQTGQQVFLQQRKECLLYQ